MTKQRYTPAYPDKFKTEVIQLLGPWKTAGQVEWETLKRVDRRFVKQICREGEDHKVDQRPSRRRPSVHHF
jgi:hypothetical protein